VRKIAERVADIRRRHPPLSQLPSPIESLRLYIARLESMWKAVMESFEQSKLDERTVTITCDEHGERRTVKTRSRPKTGDQKALRLAEKIMRDIRKAQGELAELEAKERVKEQFSDYSRTILERIEQAELPADVQAEEESDDCPPPSLGKGENWN
jgi:hypothetical protein